jgi:hypothetical protein
VLAWAAVAFGLWFLLCALIRWLRVPEPVLVAAALSWLVARVFIWAVAIVLREFIPWAGH